VQLGLRVTRSCGERWYVGIAVPENGVGGPLGVAEYLDVGAAVPKL
jgi:hypothetical protein